MNIRRMRAAIRFMRTVPRKHFDMGSWISTPGSPENREFTRRDLESCGTKACAAGWLATLPSYKRAGVSVNSAIGLVNSEALREHLDLDRYEFAQLFIYAEGVRTPKQWANYAEKWLKANGY